MDEKTADPYAFPEKLGELTFGPSKALAINSIESAWRLATLICKAKMAPSGMDTVEQVCVALLHGAEIGLPPMMSIQKIAVIGGRPTIWGDAALAVVRNSRLLDDIEETVEGEGDEMVAICRVTRKEEREKVSTFSVADAKRAGLFDDRPTVKRKMKYDGWFAGKQYKSGDWAELPNDAPWFRFMPRMLQMRARGYRLRDSFGDVLGGLYLREEFIGGQVIEHDVTERPKASPTNHPMVAPEPPEPPIDGPPEPPELSQAQPKMDKQQAARFTGEFTERLMDVRVEADLDTLWNDMVMPMIDADTLDEETLQNLQRLDDERRGAIQTG